MDNIDNRIDWVQFYSQYLKNPKTCGQNKMHACCPFHKEKHPSFWFNTKNGCFKCEGCGESGNGTVFLSKIKGISQTDAYKELAALAGVSPNTAPSKPEYSIEMYANEKCLSIEWLKSEMSIQNGSDKTGKHIKIPYRNRNGAVTATRKRYNPSIKPYFKWAQGSKLSFYGLWRLPDNPDYAILVEGESDSQSLWSIDEIALGVPGATNFQPQWCNELKNIPKVYLHIEPDTGGQTFRMQMIKKLNSGGYSGEVYEFNLKDYNVKDPSELYIKYGMDAADMIKTAMSKAEKLDIKMLAEEIPELVSGMPVRLREPEGWRLSDEGIFKYNKQTENYQRICRTPIIIVSRIRNLDTDEEKVKIAFKKNGIWRSGIYPATTIYQSKSITILAELGAMVTSENAKQIVSFLDALESENIDRIEEMPSVSQLGWADDKHFLPYAEGNIVLDVEKNMSGRLGAYKSSGSFDEWKQVIGKHRERDIFRFILSAAFAPTLLRLLNQRIFFVYNWGGSEGGKTAALHAALSVWGDPDSLKVSFNATKVGLEYTAAFYKDLPLGLNERQLAGDKQEMVEQIVYMLAEGSSKIRGMKGGGLQAIKQWRTIVIATGEVELSSGASQTGVSTRVLEIYGGPFDNKREAGDMYPFTAKCHGHAGAEFIKHLISHDKSDIEKVHEYISKKLNDEAPDRSVSHIDAVATIATADVYASMWIWDMDRDNAILRAVAMGKNILFAQPTDKERDVNENALQFVVDWVFANREQFTNNARGTRYGMEKGGKYYIIPSVLNDALKNAGYSKLKTLRFLNEKDLIPKDEQTRSYTVLEYMDEKRSRFIKFDFEKAVLMTQTQDGISENEFIDIEDMDGDLPF